MEVSDKQLIVESKAQERKNRFSSYLHRINKVKTKEKKRDLGYTPLYTR